MFENLNLRENEEFNCNFFLRHIFHPNLIIEEEEEESDLNLRFHHTIRIHFPRQLSEQMDNSCTH